ncbi:MAG: hypothetical protein AAGB46_04620 [Verrucomicrobiota bacterium]
MSDIASSPLSLDTRSINPSELSIPTLMKELNQQKKPNWILRKLMDALEAKRQSKGMGWSRPWNKFGLNVFSTHKFNTISDSNYAIPIMEFIEKNLSDAPQETRDFAEDLLSDTACLGFVFYHNSDKEDGQHEGLTLSFGRKVPEDKTKRDRIDLILEDLRLDGKVDRLVDRIRIYVCPWEDYQNEKRHYLKTIDDIAPNDQEAAQHLYQHCTDYYHNWKDEESRQWDHWSSRYISYFGPRSFIPVGTSFS